MQCFSTVHLLDIFYMNSRIIFTMWCGYFKLISCVYTFKWVSIKYGVRQLQRELCFVLFLVTIFQFVAQRIQVSTFLQCPGTVESHYKEHVGTLYPWVHRTVLELFLLSGCFLHWESRGATHNC